MFPIYLQKVHVSFLFSALWLRKCIKDWLWLFNLCLVKCLFCIVVVVIFLLLSLLRIATWRQLQCTVCCSLCDLESNIKSNKKIRFSNVHILQNVSALERNCPWSIFCRVTVWSSQCQNANSGKNCISSIYSISTKWNKRKKKNSFWNKKTTTWWTLLQKNQIRTGKNWNTTSNCIFRILRFDHIERARTVFLSTDCYGQRRTRFAIVFRIVFLFSIIFFSTCLML